MAKTAGKMDLGCGAKIVGLPLGLSNWCGSSAPIGLEISF